MIIELFGVGSHNKGSELMLLTILQELDSENLKFTIAPKKNRCEYYFYSKLGIYPKIWFKFKGIQIGYLGSLIPSKIRRLYGMITDAEVDVILDASGFSYSDQWGERPSKLMAKLSKRWKRKKKKIILMPQAFGPFNNKKIRQYMKEIIQNSDLIYARDNYSLNALLDIINAPHIKISPDFTVLLEGITPEYFNKKYQVCLIPNMRMIDKRQDSTNYIISMGKIIEYFQKKDLNPFFLIHGGVEDKSIAIEINNKLKIKIPIVVEKNPLSIKGIIKEVMYVIGSRFHALASAFYCGKIVIGMGWSHKYEYLFDDFNFKKGLIDPRISDNKLYEILDSLSDENEIEEIRKGFLNKTKIIKQKTRTMFREIKNCIGIDKE